MIHIQIHRLLYFCFFSLFFMQILVAEEPLHSLTFKPLSALNTIQTTEVRRLYQDREGYIWVATTSGLYSYDGYQVKTYKSNLYTPNLLTNNNIRCMAEDEHHRIYIGTNNGLNILEKQTGQIRKLEHRALHNNVISSIYAGADDLVLIGTDQGLFRYFVERDSLIQYTEKNTRGQLEITGISHVYKDSKEQIWIGSFSNGLYRYDPKMQRFYHYDHLNLINTSAHVITEDSHHRIWVGGHGTGLFLLNDPYSLTKSHYTVFKQEDHRSNSLCDNTVFALAEDEQTHTLWVGTRSGLSILDLKQVDQGFINYYPGKEKELPFNEINALLRDRQGNIWLGMLGGGVYYTNTKSPLFSRNQLAEVRKRLTSNSVRSMMLDDDDHLWLGIGSYGFVIEDRAKGNYTYWKELPDFASVTHIPTINTFLKSPTTGKIYLGTFGSGVIIYDRKAPVGHRVEQVWAETTDGSVLINNSHVFSMKEDSRGTLWLGSRAGLSFLTQRGEKHRIVPCMVDGKEISNNTYWCIDEDHTGAIWTGTNNEGVLRITHTDKDWGSFAYQLYSPENGKLNCADVQCVFEDSRQRLWIGTDGGGLSLYDRSKDCFLSMNESLNLPCDGVFSMQEDDRGELWLGTNAGLVRLTVAEEPTNSTFRLYTMSYGLQDNIFIRGSALKTLRGELLFGGHRGYNSFFPTHIKTPKEDAKVCVTDIKIYNQSWGSLPEEERNAVSQQSPEYTSCIELNYRQNNFIIEFSAMNFVNPMQNKYAYRLEGFDRTWQYTDATRRFAYYNNLAPGTYTFCLKVMGENGTWSQEVKKITVVVHPPFWATWWAKLAYAVLLLLLVRFAFRTARNRMLLKNKLQLREMEKSKMEELNHAKLQFFTNITHELLTPLTIISATVDELKMQAPQHQELYTVMNSNIGRLIRLLQQILEFRKAETGNLKLRVSSDDIAAFVRNEAESFRPLVVKKNLHYSVVCNPNSIVGFFDTDKIDKILYNLLSNAVKYNNEGGFIQISLTYADQKDHVQLSVKDNGQGISTEKQKTLFQRFYEGDYRKFKTIGTGIGLSLVKDLVTLHRGTIRVESLEGQGTTFMVTLPIERSYYNEDQVDEERIPLAQTDTTLAEPVTDTTESTATRKSHTLLLIEDNEELLRMMVRLLGHYYNVLTAENGREGLVVVENEEVDLIVSDIMMPEMDGIEFCRIIKSRLEHSHLPVILLTAKNKEEDRAEAYESGADAFIRKPFNLMVLHARIKNLLRSKERAARDFKHQLVFEAKELNYTSLDETFMQQAIECVNRHLDDSEFDQDQFVEEMSTSKSTLYKKLKSLTGLNTSSFIRNIRLKAACQIIEEKKAVRISELAYAVGFNDPKYFSSCFKKEFGVLPSEYMERMETEDSGDVTVNSIH